MYWTVTLCDVGKRWAVTESAILRAGGLNGTDSSAANVHVPGERGDPPSSRSWAGTQTYGFALGMRCACGTVRDPDPLPSWCYVPLAGVNVCGVV